MPEAQSPPTLSPKRPVSAESCRQQHPASADDHLDRKLNSSSPVQAESFPEPSLTMSASHMKYMSVPPSLAEMTTKLGSACRDQESQSAAASKRAASSAKAKQTNGNAKKKQKSSSASPGDKRSGYRDEVTTSPVLGLRITELPEEEEVKPRSSSPLGEFICQLCKERYADPLALAQHKCSRIVRVDYRCAECDKVFSCPANLASHRRWHKPRGAQPEEAPAAPAPVNDDHESRNGTTRGARAPSSPPQPPAQPSVCASEEEVAFKCPLCAKKFRRQAYLRKHVALHNRRGDKAKARWTQGAAQQTRPAELAPPCPRGKATCGASDVFPCRFCREGFFSSPGLTRHINKCHPTESRQVIVLSG
ncbi:insulinoma-associated protein 1b-like [Scleropages formosus]|nr:insulinoma-associated protein 1b-like [Scleropages formosus]